MTVIYCMHWQHDVWWRPKQTFTLCRILLPFMLHIHAHYNKMLSYLRDTALHGALVLAKTGSLELGDNILRTL